MKLNFGKIGKKSEGKNMKKVEKISQKKSLLSIYASMCGVYCVFQALVRIVLCVFSHSDIDKNLFILFKTFVLGAIYDIVALSYMMIPFMFIYLFFHNFITRKNKNTKRGIVSRWILNIATLVFFVSMVFVGIAEYYFWEEFQTKFNFIAVDYLVYTNETIGNIFESYNMPVIFILIGVVGFGLSFLFWRDIKYVEMKPVKLRKRVFDMAIFICIVFLGYLAIDGSYRDDIFDNQYNKEISANGAYEFVRAYFNNELDYDRFYVTMGRNELLSRLATKLMKYDKNNSTNIKDKPNIVFIVVESFSADFMNIYGREKSYTPLLDELSKECALYKNVYATGTRTVRGLEALTLSVPPTPGQSIVRRPNSDHLINIGTSLREIGYTTKFVYGGYGTFDNMNAFYHNNSYEVTDRTDIPKDEIFNETIWGVADEILFDQAIKNLDVAEAEGKPIFQLVMTTTNHRPFTFPEDRVDAPQGTREGVVRYTDWAINDFIEKSKKKSWFDNTVFVIVGDHNASAAGKVYLPVYKYKIPCMVYAPGRIAPSVNERLMSQIDVAPTVLGLLGVEAPAGCMGYDIAKLPEGSERAFISTYQLLGYLKDDNLVILSPNQKVEAYKIKNFDKSEYEEQEPDEAMVKDAITWYQGASYMYKNGLLKEKRKMVKK